ncbi:NAD(P)-dependent oxidoreductase [Staphylococcus equorum]|uniref:NADH-flavin reductase n=1 Tax=Staphylococcus equorum TaxID=246432 RepID=A0AAP7IFV5_9STAP|nr:NAD(P)H-binding protein [Staphylococcus equorum]ERH34819.1 dihydrodipicolinate reductase [Staphylococcus equorum UMC-CNS-924]MDG0825281.1 NAD(P)H-binding protein [Staphylococcus equorum]MDK9862420.1 NAD(P)H-binding protein [Staphylococcus equorum]MDK9868961.1 NAD(P)H-binding protein [Staphylococcus equorum]MEB7673514.1 NAD(P)H-binding protein [Staphylococcus equorum]
MKLAVVAANGKAGQLITKEAYDRGLDVTAIVRSSNKTVTDQVIQKNLFDLTTADIAEFDVVIDAFGQSDENKLDEHSKSMKHLGDLVSNSNKRLLIIGGAGSLYVDEAHTLKLIDSPDFPEQFKKISQAQIKTLEEIQKRKDVKWTFVCPAPDFQYDGEKTGEYKLSADEVIGSKVSYADFAQAMVDEVLEAQHIQQRFAVFAK